MKTQLEKFLDRNSAESWDVLFKDLFQTGSFFTPIFNAKSTYPTDIYEDEKSLTIEVAAAGLEKDDIEISEEHGLLTVSYNKKEEMYGELPRYLFYSDKKEEMSRELPRYLQRGIAKRSFCLSWKLSDKFDVQNIDATMDKGILKIQIPKVENKTAIKNTIQIK